MPSWKPDCLRASSTLNHISNTIQSARLLHDGHETHSVSNESTSSNKINNNFQDSNNTTTNSSKLDSPHLNNKSEHSSKALSFQNASSKVSMQKGYSVVELIRQNGSQFGLTIAGGTDKDSRPRICDLKPGSIAHRCDELQIGDMIISINNTKTQGLKHEEIIDLIKNAGDTLCLEFEYNLPPWPIHPHHAVRSQTVHIQLEKENNSYGFTIRGGFNEDKIKSRPLIVTNIRAGGPSDREGTLKIGDRILAINGINVVNATLQDAYYILKQCKGLTLFLVEYDSAIVDSIKNSNGPLLIEIEKSPGSSIGIKLTMAKSPVTGKNQILVESVKPASIADRCGAIYVGDQILSIDDVSFEHVTLAEANQILKNCVGEFSRVEILPLSQANKSANSTKGSLNSCSTPLNTNQVCHPETVEINLKPDETGTYGFTLQGPGVIMPTSHMNDVIQNLASYPVVGYVEPNSSAEKSSIMQPGDRILSVNNRSLEGLSLEEARQIIKESGSNIQLEIEFDVADSIMLTSGTFQVKLLKKNLELGISVAYPKFWKTENYPFISEIKKGSVAYRSGMLQPGDQILFIDNISLRNKPLTEVSQLLRTSEEIVKLKIKKDESYTEDNTDDKCVVYTVEMQKNGGPLGITIAGNNDIFEPMYVSGLIEGGLAERTNAIHVGDVILAINNIQLRGKTRDEAIQLLQNADDLVTLKISRKLNKILRADEYPKNFHMQTHQAFKVPIGKETSNLNIINENSEINEYTKPHQYLPFPLDMTNFIRQSQNQSNGNVNSNHQRVANQFIENLKKKGTSLDSINAVERELDEVLKDLELNSQDLNEQLEENEFQSNSVIELPITIQKNIKIETCSSSSNSSSSPSASLNKSNNSNNSMKWSNLPESNSHNEQMYSEKSRNKIIQSEFYRERDTNVSDLYIDDLSDNDQINNFKKIQQSSGMKNRQNIVSTYELCHDCFDTNLILSNSDNYNSTKQNLTHSKCCKNKVMQNVSDFSNGKTSSPINFISTKSVDSKPMHNTSVSTTTTVYNHIINPIKFSNSYSNQDLSQLTNVSQNQSFNDSYQQSRSRSVLGQINESGNHDAINKHMISSIRNGNKYISNSNSDFKTNSSNGNVISQKVFSIGMPVNNSLRSGEQSPSPKFIEQKNEDKLDKLPPVPPSTWSANASFRRRNQNFQQSPYVSNGRLKKFSNGTKNSNGFSSGESSENGSYNYRDEKTSECSGSESDTNQNENVKSSANSFKNNFELTIRESEEEDSSRNSTNLKNYDNVNEESNGHNAEIIEQIDEKVEVLINKDHRFKDFGFSIAESLHGNGIYISKIRTGSHAEQNFYLKPNTKIFKINNYDCTKIEYNQAVKILSAEQATSSTIKLVISKKPKNVLLKEDNIERNKGYDEKLNNIQNPYSANSCRATAL